MNPNSSSVLPRLPPAAASILLFVASAAVLAFLIIFGVTQSCSPAAISIFTGSVFSLPFLLLPAAVLSVKASKQSTNKFTRLSRLLLGLDASLLLALLTLLYA